MKAYFDTNVIVAAIKTEHIHHRHSYAAIDKVYRGEIEGHISGHGLVELYSVLTRSPFVTPVYPSEALILIERSILPSFMIVDITTQTHLAAISRCVKAGWRGGRIHDAVHIQAAAQAKCDLLYTYNLTDFHNLAPEWASRIQNPPPA